MKRLASVILAAVAVSAVFAGVLSAAIVEPGPYISCVAPDAATITWITTNSTSDNHVNYGATSSLGSSESAYQSITASEDGGTFYVHSARITGLSADSTYYYEVVSDGAVHDDDGSPWTFKTFPPNGTQNFSFAVYGDTRYGGESPTWSTLWHERVMRGIVNENPPLILHAGDIVKYSDNIIEWTGDHAMSGDPMGEFFRTVGSTFKVQQGTWIAIAKGNHEVMGNYPTIYPKAFEMPYSGNGLGTNNTEDYYAFDYCNARIISILHNGSEGFDPEGDPTQQAQYSWLVSELEAAQSANKWIFVIIHQPAFVPDTSSSGKYGDGFMWCLQEYIVPLFQQYNVAMVFAGHNHVCVVWNNALDYKGRSAGYPVIDEVTDGVRYQIQGADTYDVHYVDNDGDGVVETYVHDDTGPLQPTEWLPYMARKYELDVYAAGGDLNSSVRPTYCVVDVTGNSCTVTTKGMYNTPTIDNGSSVGTVLNTVTFSKVTGTMPVADIDADPTSGNPPLLVDFDGSASYDPDGSIVSWEWDFSYDGQTFNVEDTGETVQHTYTVAGGYTAALRVTDNDSHTDIDTVNIVLGLQEITIQQGLDGYSDWEDAWISEDYPGTNFGGDGDAHLQFSTQDRQLHKFDLSPIPQDATVSSATLYIYVFDEGSGGSEISAYRVITPWVESQVTYSQASSGTSWGTPGLEPGTDYDSGAAGTSPGVWSAGWASVDIANLVSQWHEGTYANEGVMLKLASGNHIKTYMSEYSTDSSLRPRLVVGYTGGGPTALTITTASLPDGQVELAYSQTVTATGGVTPYTWAVISGSLPGGLSLNSSTGEISGTPTTAETANFTVEVTDSDSPPDSDQKALSITVNPIPDLQITTTSLPDGYEGVSYSQTLAATGGVTPYDWSVISGSLPVGLSLNSSTGEISGTPTTTGTSNFTVQVIDSQTAPDSDTQALSITVNAVAGDTYYVATDGNDNDDGSSGSPWATLQHAVDTIQPGDSVIVEPGTYVGCRIMSSGGAAAVKTLKAQTAGTVLLDQPSSSASHDGILEIEGPGQTVSYWVIEGFDVDGQSQTYRGIDVRETTHITVRECTVTDAYTTGIFAAFSDYMLVENNESYNNGEHAIYVNNSADYGTVRSNVAHDNTSGCIHMNGDVSMGGDGVMSYWLVEKNTCYNTPSSAGINCDGVSDSKILNNIVYDVNGNGISLYAWDGAEGSSRNLVYNNTVVMPSTGRWAIDIPTALYSQPDPTGNKIKNNILYNAHATRGSIETYSSSVPGFESDYNVVVDRFSIDEGSSTITLSQWQSYGYDLNSITATPSELFVDPGAHDYHLKTGAPAIDAGTTLAEVTDDFDGNSRPQGDGYDIGAYEVPSGPADLVITTTSLPDGQVGVAYSQTLAATGGVTPYSWAVVSGSLPAGLSLNSSTGEISDMPTTAETANFTVEVTDSQGTPETDQQALTIYVAPEDLVITTSSLPDGEVGVAYSQTLAATGGVTPYSWVAQLHDRRDIGYSDDG
ncbi:MAG: putative Ig domain-containing protein [Planctomycetota bacterium]|jgi:parallel beta-helix repeat protein